MALLVEPGILRAPWIETKWGRPLALTKLDRTNKFSDRLSLARVAYQYNPVDFVRIGALTRQDEQKFTGGLTGNPIPYSDAFSFASIIEVNTSGSYTLSTRRSHYTSGSDYHTFGVILKTDTSQGWIVNRQNSYTYPTAIPVSYPSTIICAASVSAWGQIADAIWNGSVFTVGFSGSASDMSGKSHAYYATDTSPSTVRSLATFFWSRCLSREELVDWYRDPYQMLIPV